MIRTPICDWVQEHRYLGMRYVEISVAILPIFQREPHGHRDSESSKQFSGTNIGVICRVQFLSARKTPPMRRPNGLCAPSSHGFKPVLGTGNMLSHRSPGIKRAYSVQFGREVNVVANHSLLCIRPLVVLAIEHQVDGVVTVEVASPITCTDCNIQRIRRAVGFVGSVPGEEVEAVFEPIQLVGKLLLSATSKIRYILLSVGNGCI
ncbi:hypothetical protein EDC04DRAFT_2601467 [Pisolithus marmoratus]|nr:hypothetical protein EDC04DRAFT_2601467 [Pisolithus marmoratus]